MLLPDQAMELANARLEKEQRGSTVRLAVVVSGPYRALPEYAAMSS